MVRPYGTILRKRAVGSTHFVGLDFNQADITKLVSNYLFKKKRKLFQF